jgi:uncharacterized protein YbjT (DUF2867 family)
MIAMMGAAGNVGGKLADQLLAQGQELRVLEHMRSLDGLRARGAEVVTGDAANVEDLTSLFSGAGAAFVLLPENVADPRFVANRARMSRAIADALGQTGVPYVVALSVAGADRADLPGPPAGLHDFEQRLAGLEDTNLLVLRPATYMDYLLANLPLIRSRGVNASAIDGDRRFPMIATADVAREAAERLTGRDFAGHQAKLLLGPEDLTMGEATRAIGARLGLPELPYLTLPPGDVRGALVGAGMSEEAAALLVEMQLAVGDGRFFDGVRRTAATATPTRLEEFLAQALDEGAWV